MTTVRIGGVPEHFNLPWHLAIEDGTFEKHGINLEWTEFPEGTGAMNKALINNEIDLAVILTGGILKGIANGNPSKILQLFVDSPLQWGIHVATKSKYRAIDQLENAICAISRYGSGSHVMAYVQAEELGWDTKKLKFKEIHTLDRAIDALTEGRADYFMWEHFTTKPIVDNGVFRRLGDFPAPWSCFVIAGRNEFVNQNNATVQTVLEIINMVTKDFKNIPSIDRTLANRYGQQLEDIQEWLSMTTWSQKQISLNEIQRIQSKLYDLKMIDNLIDHADYVQNL